MQVSSETELFVCNKSEAISSLLTFRENALLPYRSERPQLNSLGTDTQ